VTVTKKEPDFKFSGSEGLFVQAPGALLFQDRTWATIYPCECRVIRLAQGCAILPCVKHEPKLTALIQEPPE